LSIATTLAGSARPGVLFRQRRDRPHLATKRVPACAARWWRAWEPRNNSLSCHFRKGGNSAS